MLGEKPNCYLRLLKFELVRINFHRFFLIFINSHVFSDLASADVVVAKTKHQAFENTDKLQSELDRTNEELRSLQQLCEELMVIVESKDNSVENHAS